MIDEACPVCEARRERALREHYERLIAIHKGHLERLVALKEEHRRLVMHEAEWYQEQLEVVERLHTEHVGGNDA